MSQVAPVQSAKRILSLDVLRGLIMLLLAAESCMLYYNLEQASLPSPVNAVVMQFFHHPWHGLRFWDLVQPAFMTMAGAALYISYHYKRNAGVSWSQNLPHILKRCARLLALGVALHCIYAGRLVWELWNVLAQLAVTTVIAYLIIRRSPLFQVIFSIALLVLTELLYRNVHVDEFTQPFTWGKNFGSWMDTILMGKINTDGWVAFNFIPTAAHTIWGVLAGRLLVSAIGYREKLKYLVVAAAACLMAGYLLDWLHVTPIIKRICTSSFVLVSGGWVLLMIAALYLITDVWKRQKYAWIFVVMGMNAIFIYMFFETVGHQWLNPTVLIFVKGILSFASVGEQAILIASSLVTLLIEWWICYWLYKKKIFFKL